MVYPEFARYIRGLELRRGPIDARAGGYDQGYDAYWSGESPADNPFPPDSADHLAWENGWSEALDEDFRWTGPALRARSPLRRGSAGATASVPSGSGRSRPPGRPRPRRARPARRRARG